MRQHRGHHGAEPFTSLPPTDQHIAAGFTLGDRSSATALLLRRLRAYERRQRRIRELTCRRRRSAQADFIIGADPIYDPATGGAAGWASAFRQNQIHANRISHPLRGGAAKIRCRTFPARRSARSIMKTVRARKNARTSSTSKSRTRQRRTTICRFATDTRMPGRWTRERSACGAASRTMRGQAPSDVQHGHQYNRIWSASLVQEVVSAVPLITTSRYRCARGTRR